ncbi:MAG: hypothetical protein OXE50_00340 [Chloroflexi bacterium]|nr:hypothetical protein [Chloroflexota bacterium]
MSGFGIAGVHAALAEVIPGGCGIGGAGVWIRSVAGSIRVPSSPERTEPTGWSALQIRTPAVVAALA